METGHIVEYIDREKIMCAVILEVKEKRLRVLNQNNREVNLSANRLSHKCKERLNLTHGRNKTVEALKNVAYRREELIARVDIKELWEVLNSEQEWIDLATMTEFCFPKGPSQDHESAVIRAFFSNRSYFKFNTDRFFPYTPEQVDQIAAQKKEAERRSRLVSKGIEWPKTLNKNEHRPIASHTDDEEKLIDIFKSIYLYGKDSPSHRLGKEIISGAGFSEPADLFPVLVKIGVWSEDENTDLKALDIPDKFSVEVITAANEILESAQSNPIQIPPSPPRLDFTKLSLMTVDGQSTLDYDDAISLAKYDEFYLLGVHIVDVGHRVKRDSALDHEALNRCSSIYMPDQRIPMLPASLAEDLCSLKAGQIRPAISTMVKLSPALDIVSFDVVPTLVKVDQQLTYYDVNLLANENQNFLILKDVATKFRSFRLDSGAVQINLPEIHVWVGESGEVSVNRINRESPGRMMISELMIMANWLMARYLKDQNVPAIYRSQPAAKERLYQGNSDSLYQNIMQRRLLNRFVLGHAPEDHSGLGLNAYTTATSPIRKYCDLVTQRQIRSIFGLETAYSTDEIDNIIHQLELPMSQVSRLQQRRLRYWVLKHLEKRIGEKEEAIVLNKRRRGYQVLIPEYMLECEIPFTSGLDLKPEDLVQVVIQRVHARKDVLNVFVG
jgi:exoribonuclease-2